MSGDKTEIFDNKRSPDVECDSNRSKRVKLEFKSPKIKQTAVATESEQDLQAQIQTLRDKIAGLEAEIIRLEEEEECKLADIDLIIDKLHLFNDVKDTAQMLLEKMANIRCVTIREMHEMYDISLDDEC